MTPQKSFLAALAAALLLLLGGMAGYIFSESRQPDYSNYPPLRQEGILPPETMGEGSGSYPGIPPAGSGEELPEGEEGVVCTMEAKICPDGSSVGRMPPNCEFSPCP